MNTKTWLEVRYPEYLIDTGITKTELASAYSGFAEPRETMTRADRTRKFIMERWWWRRQPSKSWKMLSKCRSAYQRHWRKGKLLRMPKLSRYHAEVMAWESATDYMMVA